ncbi:MAG TPA: S49 family peptidase, partial [Myxococcota bacterium]|nr:S49 family peptidase [Myxococcota bacterium]
DEVILSPPGEINLTGLRAEVPFFKETFERVGVQPYTEQRYEYKNFANTFTQTGFTPPHKEALKGVLDDLQQTLLEIIAEGRDVDVPTARTWVSQAPFSADAALEDKLVDRLAYWDEVVEDAKRVAGRDEPFMEADSYGARRALTAGGVRLALIIGAGEINRGESGSGGMGAPDGIGSDTFAQAFRDARQDGVKGVLFRIDSPGGSYIASDLIRREVELTRKAGIPVVVSMGNTAASGGYFIAADADAIVAEPGTITGSIGVFAASFAVRQALHRWLGVNFDTYETLPHAGSLNWLDPPSDADRARFSQTVDRIYKDFVTKVAAGRHKTYDEIHAVARGRIWSGRQAVQNGLADELGGMETALEALRRLLKLADDQEVHLTLYPEPENALAMLRNLLSVQTDLPRPVRAALGPWLRLWSSPGARALLPLQPEPL